MSDRGDPTGRDTGGGADGGNVVIVMAKAPTAGATKTRLIPALSVERAADLAECFLRDAIALARSVDNTTTKIAVAPPDAGPYFASIASDLGQLPQMGDSLGERLAHVMTAALDQGHDRVVAINADGPTLPRSRLGDAFDRLDGDDVDVVLGPAEDGGYYLIGWKRPHPRLVRDVTMSTPNVLADTLAIAAEDGLGVALLEPWYDVDEPADLERLRADVAAGIPCGLHTRKFLAATS